MNFKNNFPFFKQTQAKDCGATCLKIISKFYGVNLSRENLRNLSETTRSGSSLQGLSTASEKIGLKSLGCVISYNTLKSAPLPCIVHWKGNHFVVVYKISNDKVYISDPSYGLINYSADIFITSWIGQNANKHTEEGVTLLLEPTPKFYEIESSEDEENKGFLFKIFSSYFKHYKNFFIQLILGLIGSSILQIILPFLTQSIVDIGIANQDINFIYLVLFAQLALFLGRTSIEIIRNWILLNLSTRINISLISNFFVHLMSLPISYFDVRMTGDIMQRINDHKRIEKLITSSSLNILFSSFNIIILGFVLLYYDFYIFLIFFLGSMFYFVWILFFLKRREELDYRRFAEMGRGQSKVVELINGMQEIKLHNAEREKRWGWEHIQARLFNVSIKSLALEQYQQIGSSFINEVKNIFIIFLSAKLVIDGQITLGTMLAISYIVGQLNSPITQIIEFIREWQDAKISFLRLGEINKIKGEDTNGESDYNTVKSGDINISNLSYKYPGSANNVLNGLNLNIEKNKITAIVGASGSGKTTLLKILLKFYEPSHGNVMYSKVNLNNISQRSWRKNIGVVMQESYIFNDTIANNIAIGEDQVDKKKLEYAVKTSNIKDFIETLPANYNTYIGNEGIGLSTGQKQRIFIARAIYKNPDILFLDEATSALDANNESEIVSNLNQFFISKTVLIIAHRLSTVKNADKIVVLDNGHIIEEGKHDDLISKRGYYYNLIKNQLELG